MIYFPLCLPSKYLGGFPVQNLSAYITEAYPQHSRFQLEIGANHKDIRDSGVLLYPSQLRL